MPNGKENWELQKQRKVSVNCMIEHVLWRGKRNRYQLVLLAGVTQGHPLRQHTIDNLIFQIDNHQDKIHLKLDQTIGIQVRETQDVPKHTNHQDLCSLETHNTIEVVGIVEA